MVCIGSGLIEIYNGLNLKVRVVADNLEYIQLKDRSILTGTFWDESKALGNIRTDQNYYVNVTNKVHEIIGTYNVREFAFVKCQIFIGSVEMMPETAHPKDIGLKYNKFILVSMGYYKDNPKRKNYLESVLK